MRFIAVLQFASSEWVARIFFGPGELREVRNQVLDEQLDRVTEIQTNRIDKQVIDPSRGRNRRDRRVPRYRRRMRWNPSG